MCGNIRHSRSNPHCYLPGTSICRQMRRTTPTECTAACIWGRRKVVGDLWRGKIGNNTLLSTMSKRNRSISPSFQAFLTRLPSTTKTMLLHRRGNFGRANSPGTHSGTPTYLLEKARLAKEAVFDTRTKPRTERQRLPVLPLGIERDSFLQVLADVKGELGDQNVEINDKPLVVGWGVIHF